MRKPPECTGCPFAEIGKGYAPQIGPPEANLYVVGETLGAEGVIKGRPFAGGSGRILDKLLKNAGTSRDRVVLDNAMRCNPPGNKIPKKFDPILCAQRHLFPALAKHKPNTILVLGNTPLSVLTGLDKISKRRGSVVKSVHGKVVATLHPSTLMRQQSMFFVVIADIKKAVRESLYPEMPSLVENYNMFPTLLKVKNWGQGLQPLSVDIETTWNKYWENALICIGFSTLNKTICIPWLKQGGKHYWPSELRREVIRQVQRLLNHPTMFQNGFFDVQVLEAIGFKVPNFIFDTMLAHHLMYAELPHDLGFICSLHTPLPYYKDEAKSDAGALALTDKTFRGYNCKDVYGTAIAAKDLASDLHKTGNWEHFQAVTMKLPRILLNMQKRGIYVDHSVLKKAIIEYSANIAFLKSECVNTGIPSGTKALKEYLFHELKLPVVKRSKKTKQPSLDKDAFNKLSRKILIEKEKLNGRTDTSSTQRLHMLLKGEEAIGLIGNLNRQSKVLSTYLRGLPIGPDGRVHCSWLQHGTKNQRLSSRDPNLQNVPEGIAKGIYIAAPGHLFYMFDYSQIELRIIAYEAEDLPLIRVFEEGRDPHEENTRAFFNLGPTDSWTEIQRKFCKAFVYCLNYGGDVAAVLVAYPGFMSYGEAQRRQAQYYAKRPAIDQFRKRIEEEVRTNRSVVNPFGLKRMFFGAIGDNIRSAYNYPIQSGAADVINKACIRLHRKNLMDMGKEGGAVLQIHDALGYELHSTKYILAIKNEMEKPVWIRGRKVDLPVDIKVGRNWNDMKKLDIKTL